MSRQISTSLADIRVLYHRALRPIRGRDHADRLDQFYKGQAEHYDQFRRKLLPGRAELFQSLPVSRDGVWVDLGGGTGANLEWLGDRLSTLRRVYVVDLSTALLDVAAQRIKERGWNNVETVRDDAAVFRPAEKQVDVVTFSYSLTRIPEWYAAVTNAAAMLAPGGHVGVVVF